MPLVRCSRAELEWRVESLDEAPLIQVRARRFVSGRGFDTRAEWSIVIAASELATNAVKYAGGGTLSLAWVDDPPHVRLEVTDDGPGIADLSRAIEDFVSDGVDLRAADYVTGHRGLGTGLGSIGRLMDSCAIENRPEGGLRVVAHKHLGARPRG